MIPTRYWLGPEGALCRACAGGGTGCEAVREGCEGAGGNPLACARCGEQVGNRLDEQALTQVVKRLRRYDRDGAGAREEARALVRLARAYAGVIAEHARVDVVLTRERGWVGRRVAQRQRDVVAALHRCAGEGPEGPALERMLAEHDVIAAPDAGGRGRGQGKARALWRFARAHFREAEIDAAHEATIEVRLRVACEADAPGTAEQWVRNAWRAMHAHGSASAAARRRARAERTASTPRRTALEWRANGKLVRSTWTCAIEIEGHERRAAIEECEVPEPISDAVGATARGAHALEERVRTVHDVGGTHVEATVHL